MRAIRSVRAMIPFQTIKRRGMMVHQDMYDRYDPLSREFFDLVDTAGYMPPEVCEPAPKQNIRLTEQAVHDVCTMLLHGAVADWLVRNPEFMRAVFNAFYGLLQTQVNVTLSTCNATAVVLKTLSTAIMSVLGLH
jgi:hypothetical protein